MDWEPLERQLAALGAAVAEGARSSADDAERASRSLERLTALERLLGPSADEVCETEPSGPAGPRRASLHRSPLADLFRDTDLARRPD